MVIRKLASSLIAIFKNVNSSWEHTLWQLAASLSHGAYVKQQDCQRVDFLTGLLPTLSTPKATALAFFSVALAEEALRLDNEPRDSVRTVIRRVMSNMDVAFVLVKFILEKITDHSMSTGIPVREINVGNGITVDQAALVNEAMGTWRVRDFLLLDPMLFQTADSRTRTTKMLTYPCFSDLASSSRKSPPLLYLGCAKHCGFVRIPYHRQSSNTCFHRSCCIRLNFSPGGPSMGA